MRLSDSQKQLIEETTKSLTAQGYRVFVAESGTHGFYTDREGSRVVSFECDGLRFKASGNYRTSSPRTTGTGWVMTQSFQPSTDAEKLFQTVPPQWALSGATFKFTTLRQYLATYGVSSGYQEVSA